MNKTPHFFAGSGTISNDQQLYSIMGTAINNAVIYCMGRMLDEYKDLIKSIVYAAYSPEEYQRTYEFLESWQTETNRTDRGGEGQLFQDANFMHFETSGSMDAPNIHGSFWSGAIGEALTGIIYEGTSGDLFGNGAWRDARDAWTPLLKELDDGKLDYWFRKAMRQQGFELK
jgi:hypothetical protein